MIAFAQFHPGWFAIAAIAVECGIIFGLMICLPKLAESERPAWMEFESDETASALPCAERGPCEASAAPGQNRPRGPAYLRVVGG